MFNKQLAIGLIFSVASCFLANPSLLAQDTTPQAHTGTVIQQPFHPNPGHQPFQGQPAPLAHTGTNIQNPNQQVIAQLRNILNQQAQFSQQYPSNNALLRGIQNLVNQHGNPFASPTPGNPPTGSVPPVGSVPPSQGTVVMITNSGPGNLQVMRQNQNSFTLPPGNSQQMTVNSTIQFKATQNNTHIAIQHLQGGLAKFWDADDDKFTRIRPNQTQNYELGINKLGYQLMKYN